LTCQIIFLDIVHRDLILRGKGGKYIELGLYNNAGGCAIWEKIKETDLRVLSFDYP